MFHITNQAVDAKQINSKPKRGAVMCRKVGHMRCKAPRAERCREQAKKKEPMGCGMGKGPWHRFVKKKKAMCMAENFVATVCCLSAKRHDCFET